MSPLESSSESSSESLHESTLKGTRDRNRIRLQFIQIFADRVRLTGVLCGGCKIHPKKCIIVGCCEPTFHLKMNRRCSAFNMCIEHHPRFPSDELRDALTKPGYPQV